MSPRGTGTRERIIEVALELFSERGYERTSLREIAERLSITKAALYYHFPSKEALLVGITASLTESLEELVEWSKAQPRTAETRQELLRRLAALIQGRWSAWIRFAQENQPALREHPEVAAPMREAMTGLFGAIIDPDDDAHAQLRSLLGLVSIYLGNLPPVAGLLGTFGVRATQEELQAAAMDVALDLVGK